MGSPRARLGLVIGVVMDCYIRLREYCIIYGSSLGKETNAPPRSASHFYERTPSLDVHRHGAIYNIYAKFNYLTFGRKPRGIKRLLLSNWTDAHLLMHK